MRLRRGLAALGLVGVAGVTGLAVAPAASAAPPPGGHERVSREIDSRHGDFRQFHDEQHRYFIAFCREQFPPRHVYNVRVFDWHQLVFLERAYDLRCEIVRIVH